MEKCIFKRQILFVAFVLLGCLMTYAADDDLITRQIKLKLEKAGTLPDKISSTKKNKITNLKIIGDINGTDLRFIREMAGGDCYGNPTDGHLTSLDLYEANIVEGGDYYYHNVERPFYCKANAIGYCAFWGCSGLTSVTIPSSVTEIGDGAFQHCSGLTSVTIPSSVTKIGDGAFQHCSGLTSVTIPSSVTEIGTSAFSDCSGLTSVTVPSSVTKIGDNAFSGCSGLTSVTIPSSVTKIGDNAFSGCSGLTSVTIPSSVTEIGSSAFSCCSGLTSVTIPSSVTEIGSSAFSDCRGLTSVTVPSSVTKIGDNTFSGCSGLTSVTIPSSVTEIGSSAFSGCSGLTSVTIPSSVTKIGDNAFSGCSGLTSVYVSWKTPLLNGADKFKDVDKQSCTLYVPQDTSGEYYLSEWGDYFDNIVEYDVTGINKVKSSANVTELSRYSVNGHRLDSPTKGLNIVKYSDGSVRKIAVQ